MSISLNKLCIKAEKKYNLKLIAGKNGLENTIRWVHIVEDLEVPDFLNGAELIFTTGIAHHKDGWLISFVCNLIKNKCSGLVVNLGPHIMEIPPQVIVFCEQNDFPLFIVPWETRLVDMTYEFCRIIINNETVEQSLADCFKNLIISPEKSDGYKTTLEKMGFKQNSNYTLMMLRFFKNGTLVSTKLQDELRISFLKLSKLNSYPRGAFMWNKSLVLVYQNLEETHLRNFTDRLQKFKEANQGLDICAGISNHLSDYKNLGILYNQSKASLEISKTSEKLMVNYNDIGVYKILFDVRDKSILKEFYNNVLGDLVSYDMQNKTDFHDTLKQYIEQNGSVQKISEINNTHRNTINYKLKRAKEILKRDFDYHSNMEIKLAFMISNIIKNLGENDNG